MVGEMNGKRIEFHKISNQFSFLFIIIKKKNFLIFNQQCFFRERFRNFIFWSLKIFLIIII